MTLDDQKHIISLWIQFLDGNENAFSQLYCLFLDDLLTYGRRVGGDNEMVEDLIQDLFLKLYQKKIILEDNTRLRPFLFRALKNLIYNQLLRNAKLQPLPDYDFAFDLNYTIDEQLSLTQDQGLSDEIHHILKGLTGRQKEIIVAGKTRKIDMLFYHIKLRCYVVVELKAVSFEPEFAGKLNFYVNAVNELMKSESANPTIGLLICKDKDQTEVQWAFQGIKTPMGVATYDNIWMNEIKSQLPSEEAIQKRLEQAEEEYILKLKEKNK